MQRPLRVFYFPSHPVVSLALLMSAAAIPGQGQTYFGNGGTGFGGTLGNGSLTLTDDGTTVSGTFNNAAAFNNAVVLYIDSEAGGFSSTMGFTDVADGLRQAISGTNGTDRTTATFDPGFEPDYAVAFNATFAGVWELTTGSHNFVTSASIMGTGPYTFSFPLTAIGSPSGSYDFAATLISETAFRSDEAIGYTLPPMSMNPGFTGGITLSPSSVALPVELVRFAVEAGPAGGARLTWQTASELNNAGFHVERSADAGAWSEVGFVAAANTESALQEYAFVDGRAPTGLQYYRLRQVDLDGTVDFSEVRQVVVVAPTTGLALAPNPSDGAVRVYATDGATGLTVRDASGRLVARYAAEAFADRTLSLSHLPPGVYVVRCGADAQRLVLR